MENQEKDLEMLLAAIFRYVYYKKKLIKYNVKQ